MELDLERLRRANEELQAWVRDLLEENRALRAHLAAILPPDSMDLSNAAEAACRAAPHYS